MDYVTFVEAMRKGQVRQDMGSVPSKPLDKFYREQDWAIPVPVRESCSGTGHARQQARFHVFTLPTPLPL